MNKWTVISRGKCSIGADCVLNQMTKRGWCLAAAENRGRLWLSPLALSDWREIRHRCHRANKQQCRRWYSDPTKHTQQKIAITRRCRMRFNSIGNAFVLLFHFLSRLFSVVPFFGIDIPQAHVSWMFLPRIFSSVCMHSIKWRSDSAT